FFASSRHPTSSILFPYTTLFRSGADGADRQGKDLGDEKPEDRSHADAEGKSVDEDREDADPSRVGHQPQPDHGDGLTDHRDREQDRKSTRLNSSHVSNSYAVFCL